MTSGTVRPTSHIMIVLHKPEATGYNGCSSGLDHTTPVVRITGFTDSVWMTRYTHDSYKQAMTTANTGSDGGRCSGSLNTTRYPGYACYDFPGCRAGGMACLIDNNNHQIPSSAIAHAWNYITNPAENQTGGGRLMPCT